VSPQEIFWQVIKLRHYSVMHPFASVGYELTQMNWNSRVNSLAVIYEFDLTQLKEYELW